MSDFLVSIGDPGGVPPLAMRVAGATCPQPSPDPSGAGLAQSGHPSPLFPESAGIPMGTLGWVEGDDRARRLENLDFGLKPGKTFGRDVSSFANPFR
jgi:hypothetical protein